MMDLLIQVVLQSGALAVEPPSENSIVVTATRLPITDELAAVEGEQIRLHQPFNLVEALDALPGVRAATTAGPGGPSFVSVRGGDPNFTLVTIDGVRVNDPASSQGGGFDFAQIDPSLIERVQLVTDIGSATYGSDALAGVLSIALRSPETAAFAAGIGALADTERALQGSAYLSSGWNGGGILAAASLFDRDNSGEGSTLRRQQGLLRASHRLGGLDVSGFALVADTDRLGFAEASGGPRLAATDELEQRDTQLAVLGLSFQAPAWPVRPRIALGWTAQRTDLDSPAILGGESGGLPAMTSQSDLRRLQATTDFRLDAGEGLSFAAGGEYIRETGDSRGSLDFGFPVPTNFHLARDQLGLFAEALWRPQPWLRIGAALRHDIFSGASETTPYLSAAIHPGDDLPRLRISFSEGYKLPSLYALGNPLVGNPDLRPERSRTFQLSLLHRLNRRLSAFFVAHHSRYRDLIDFDFELFTTVNRNRVGIAGFEAGAEYRRSEAVAARISVGYLDLESEVPLRSRPEWQGQASLSWRPAAGLLLRLQGRFNSGFLEGSVPTGVIKLSGHSVIDASAAWELGPQVRLTGTIANITDADYENAVGFPEPGRALRIGLNFGL